MNIMKDFSLPEQDLEKIIVKESLRAINAASEKSGVKSHICGGMAVSGYLPPNIRRSTIDLDFTFLWGGNCEEFRELMNPFVEYLRDKGFSVEVKKRDKTYDISVRSSCDFLLVQHQIRTRKNFEKQRRCLEREFAHNRRLFKQDVVFDALSPEDIALHKLSRILTFSDVYGIEIPQRFKILNIRNMACQLKEEIKKLAENADARDIARLRIYHDVYDIMALAEYVGFNMPYFEKGLSDWTSKYMDKEKAIRLLKYIGASI